MQYIISNCTLENFVKKTYNTESTEDLFKPFASGQLEETGRTGAGAGRCRSRWHFGMSFQTAGDKRLLRADV